MKLNKKPKGSKENIRFFSLVNKNMKTMFRDRGHLAWIIGYPLMMIVIFSLAFGSSHEYDSYNVIYFNEDPNDGVGMFSDQLIKILDNSTYFILNDTIYTPDEAEDDLKFEFVAAIIYIPSDFSEKIISGEKPEINVSIIPDQVAQGVVRSVIKQIVDNIIIINSGGTPSEINVEEYGDAVEFTGFDYMAPGFVIMGITVCISQLVLHYAEEKETGTLKRLTTTPVARRDILLSGMVSQLAVALFQTLLLLVLLLAFGAYFDPGANIILLVLIPLLFSFTCLGFGVMIASFIKSQKTAGALVWFIILPLQFLGNVFFTIPGDITKYIPTSYATHSMRLIMLTGVSSWEALWADILILTVFGIATTIIGIILFQRKTAIV